MFKVTQSHGLNPVRPLPPQAVLRGRLSTGSLDPISLSLPHSLSHRWGLTWDSHVWASRILRRLWGWPTRRSRHDSLGGWAMGTQGSNSR